MPTNRDQSVVKVLEEFREMVRASARKSGDEIVTMTLRDLRALVEPPSTPTDAELMDKARSLDASLYCRHRNPASEREDIILTALKSTRASR